MQQRHDDKPACHAVHCGGCQLPPHWRPAGSLLSGHSTELSMHALYSKALLRLILLLGVSILFGYLCVIRSYHRVALFEQDDFSWQLRTHSTKDATTNVNARVDAERLIMEFVLSGSNPHSYISTGLLFTDRNRKPALFDWSRFGKISFEARCFPAGTIRVGLTTFDDKLSKPEDLMTYRPPGAYIKCNQDGARVELDLAHLTIPDWWVDMNKLNQSDLGYSLAKVAQIEFGTSNASPVGTLSRIEIGGIELHERKYGYLYLLAALLILAWTGFAFWFAKQYALALANDLRARMQKDLPLVAYQQLALEPHREREKSAILRLLATRYADPELDMETVVSETGVNRNKVNDILKKEMGYTFVGYLNKLRLTEASRLLVENTSASIAEIAYSVGYKNSSYFNKLFKEEYECTPKAFREVCKKDAREPAS
ncbi:helix-turn-helix domain-containing protein [Pseudoduganella albidiflava]|uniref:AraC family transcriptional regulator n=2 Tax=Pseudoduganella albidiflava TaxID=321983 RepID=A0ABX5RU04_9BURK|nr:helix-turn-helix transcriptional regulator [Pseudoduganella albidiflava]QBI01719.1 AraC family transcriptional regulator [Pseudoduganella albidiflava]